MGKIKWAIRIFILFLIIVNIIAVLYLLSMAEQEIEELDDIGETFNITSDEFSEELLLESSTASFEVIDGETYIDEE